MTKQFANLLVLGGGLSVAALTACSGEGDDGERARADVAEYCESNEDELCEDAELGGSEENLSAPSNAAAPQRAGEDQTAGDPSFKVDIDDFKG